MSIKFQTPKDPQEFLDYSMDWTSRMQRGDTIVEANVVSVGVTTTNVTVTGNTVTVWVAGGNTGTVANIEFTVTSDAGRIMQETGLLKIVDK